MFKRFMFFVLCITVLSATAMAQDSWITFRNEDGNEETYLMKIDALGNILVEPHIIVSSSAASDEGGSALKHGSAGKLLVYVVGSNDQVFRVIVDEATLAASGAKALPVFVDDDDYVAVTDKLTDNFLVGDVSTSGAQFVRAFPINNKGIATGESFRMVTKVSSDEGNVAADGRVSLSVAVSGGDDALFYQILNSKGRGVLDPVKVASTEDIENSDVTDELSGDRRFVIYDDDSNSPETFIFLQQVRSSTGAKLGSPILVSDHHRDEDDQILAIDSLGRFLIYVSGEGCPSPYLAFQALDGDGHPTGTVKELTECEFAEVESINLLRD